MTERIYYFLQLVTGMHIYRVGKKTGLFLKVCVILVYDDRKMGLIYTNVQFFIRSKLAY